jgi:streptomycin 6-kinase
MEFQTHFVQSVRLYFKNDGEEWLKKLPSIIQYCETKWKLKINKPFSLSINYVALATMNDGREVVVKICIPGKGFQDELVVLQLFNGQGMVKLIDFEIENGILILEKLSPGNTLGDVPDDEEACRIAAKVIRKLTKVAPTDSTIPTIRVREENLRRMINEHPTGIGPFTYQILQKALNIFIYLNNKTSLRQLLHGDFHHYNVLASGDGEWTAIDPKGLIGEVEYDLIQYMLNKLPENNAFETIKKRVDIFTNELQLNEQRLLLWGYCHTVLSTSWSVDEKQNYDTSFYQGVAIFEKLYESKFGSMEKLINV